MADGMHFETHAEIYDEARPPYPMELWKVVRDLGPVEPDRRALDLGAGSGQATGPLLAAGLQVTAVEPGPQLARLLTSAYPAATVIQGRAEDVTLPDRSFHLAVAATSIHWMDLDVLLPRVHRWLRPDGMFLVWRNVFGDPGVRTPFRDEIDRIVAERQSAPRPPQTEDVTAMVSALTRTGHFTSEAVHTFRWSIELDDQQVHRLFTTFSDWSEDEVDRAASAVRDLGGTVREHYASWLVVARPHPAAGASQ